MNLEKRIKRLEALARGLAIEADAARKNGPFLFVERQTYVDALHKAIAGVEEARLALARTHHRIKDESQSRDG